MRPASSATLPGPVRSALRLLWGGLLLALTGVIAAACSDDEQPPAGCGPETCPEGCCSAGACVTPTATACGLSGAACADCTEDGTTDSCAAGRCVCAATGTRCSPGTYCTSNGCGDCEPQCDGKCAGADDGCGGECVNDDCPDGCCDVYGLCVPPVDQDADACGPVGTICASCSADPLTDSCDEESCICGATGAACSPGTYCTSDGCGDCQPQCDGKCAGADDGCGGECVNDDCPDGCCSGTGQCVPYASQGPSQCGPAGERCVDCEAFGYTCSDALHTCLSTATNAALFVGQSVPLEMTPGEVVSVSVTLRNIGTSTWTAAESYALGAENPRDNSTWGVDRVVLDSGDAIAPGEAKTFSFQVTAPSSPGMARFQWRMVQDGVEWFGDFSDFAPVAVGTPDVTVCEAARALAGTQTDAQPAIQGCIDAASAGSAVELPAGTYRIDGPVLIDSLPIVLRTEGSDWSTPRCAEQSHGCAELEASTAFAGTGGILQVSAAGTVLDHLVIDGNKTARAATTSGQECASGNNQYGHNLRIGANDCALLSSVTKNALCGTGCEVVGSRARLVLWRTTVADNGVHDQQGLWADGVTIHEASATTVAGCDFRDNTDVDLIFGGCQHCYVHRNEITHTEAFAGGSFAALMLHAWTTTNGNFTGTHTTENLVDCGASRRCGFGLLIGSDPWYSTDVYGGAAYRNPVRHAQIGVAIDDAHDLAVFDNHVEDPALTSETSCGVRAAHAYTMGAGSHDVDRSRDTMGTSYTSTDYDGCIANWWQ